MMNDRILKLYCVYIVSSMRNASNGSHAQSHTDWRFVYVCGVVLYGFTIEHAPFRDSRAGVATPL